MKNLPKIELHCHLDGSVRPSTIADIAKKEKILLPSFDIEEIKGMISVNSDCDSLEEYLTKFDLPITVMQSEYSLERISYELFEDAQKDNVKYLEVRFGANLHLKKGLSIKNVIESVLSGMRRAEKEFDIRGNIILSGLRSDSIESLHDLIEVGKEYIGNGVVGIDLCAVEEEGFSSKYIEAFEIARKYGFRVTIHAGEVCSGNNILEAIEMLGAERIGHGINLKTSEKAYHLVKAGHINLEMCPTSNIQTKAVDSYETHPIVDFLREGISVSISTDNKTVSNTTMSREIEIVSKNMGMTLEEYKLIFGYSVESSFADENTKKDLLKYII
jgi:adenosine deaminase